MTTTAILRDNDPIPGQKFCALSIVGPGARQETKVFGWKLHYVTEDLEDAKKAAEQFQRRDPAFDVYVAEVGKWTELDVRPDRVKDQRFNDRLLTDMVRERQEEHDRLTSEWDRQFAERREAVHHELTPAGQEKLRNAKESCVAIRFKIRQHEELLKARKKELETLYREYQNNYSEQERRHAESLPMPIPSVPPMQYDLYNSSGLESPETLEPETLESPETLASSSH